MWIAALLVAGAAGLMGLLAIPLDLRFQIARREALVASLRWEWLFGQLVREIERKPRGPKKTTSAPEPGKLLALLREPLRSRLVTLVRRSLRWLSIGELRGRARLGMTDPADTGMMMGVLYPLLAQLTALSQVDLVIEPDFAGEALQGHLHGSLRAIPLGLLAALIAFAASPSALRALREIRPRPK